MNGSWVDWDYAVELICVRLSCSEGRAQFLLREACRSWVRYTVCHLRPGGIQNVPWNEIGAINRTELVEWLNDKAPVEKPEQKGQRRRRAKLQDGAMVAIAKLYPSGVPPQAVLPNDKLVTEVLKQMKADGLPAVEKTTVLRASGRRGR